MADRAKVGVPMKPAAPKLPEMPRLRAGCQLTLHEFREGAAWVLEDPVSGKFFRVGLREERLIRRLDGKQNILQIIKPVVGADGQPDPNQLQGKEVLQFLQTLMTAGLLEDAKTLGLVDSLQSPAAAPAKSKAKTFNPLYIKLPLGNPNAFFGWVAAGVRRLPLWPTLLAVVALYVVGFYTIVANSERLWSSAGSVFSIANAPAFFLSFILLKALHETGHGVACRLFGGRVPQAGLYFVLFMPLTYIDASDAWRFPSRRVRSLITAAGMLVEFVVASIAALVWVNTEPGLVNTVALNTVITASVTTLLFNANPLMRFDGYFLLSDWLGIPNLYMLAGKAARAWFARCFLGVRGESYPFWITAYGIGCMFWRLTITVSIAVGAIVMLHGIGLIFAMMTVAAMLIPLLRGAVRLTGAMIRGELKISPVRLASISVLLLGVCFIPLERAPAVHGVIEPANRTVVRVQCPGFVEELAVRPGQTVSSGQLLFRLLNKQEEIRLATLATSARRAEAVASNQREAFESKKMVQHLEQASALRKRAAEVEAYLDTLSVRAPADGVVFAPRLADLPGRYLRTGQEILVIGSATDREALIAIPQEAFHRIRPQVGQKVRIFVPGHLRYYSATLTAVESAATRMIRHEPLTAYAGGPLAVTHQAQGRSELADPHFYLTALLDAEDGTSPKATPSTLRLGERCLASFPAAERRTVVKAAVETLRRYIRTTEERAESRQHAS